MKWYFWVIIAIIILIIIGVVVNNKKKQAQIDAAQNAAPTAQNNQGNFNPFQLTPLQT